MALPKDHLAKFHKMTDAKELWDAIKSRFGGNDDSKKMQKYILKNKFEGFSVTNTEGLHNGYDRFKVFCSQLDISWSRLYCIILSPLNVAFISENTSSTNEVSTAYCVPNPCGQNSQYEQTSSYLLLANQSSCPQLDHEEPGNDDEYDLGRNGLEVAKQLALIKPKLTVQLPTRRLFARECRIKGNQDNRRRDAWNSGTKDGSKTGKKEDSKALVTIDGEGVDWTNHSEEDEDYALMACNSSESDTEREQLSDAKHRNKKHITQGSYEVEGS
ncbi:hypothetical protein Tco_0841648 [Tanacetum coccineum]|uniref:Uncharacterized protein n=1 Tax=Tanacetum coccineum TaxID=301880 RepID=A0ABQ5B1B0_9ASTR